MVTEVDSITCRTCGEEYPATTEFFYGRKDGFRRECKACVKTRSLANARKRKALDPEAWRAKEHEYDRRYRESHPNAAHEKYLRSKTRHQELMRKWRKENPVATRTSTARYRARKNGAVGTHTAEDVALQMSMQCGLCYWCGAKLDQYEVDHFFPISKGGGDGPDNIVVACVPCNRSKHAKQPEDFIWQLVNSGPRASQTRYGPAE